MTKKQNFQGLLPEKEADGSGDDVFSVNLLENSKKHISFLNGLHSLGVTFSRPSEKTLERYRDQWLPLICRHSKTNNNNHENNESNNGGDRSLIPPPDIAWMFHCHRLAPFRYAKYCRKKRLFTENGKIPDAHPPFSFQTETGNVHGGSQLDCEDTQRLWEQLYPEEPFFLDEHEDCKKSSDEDIHRNEKEQSSLLLDGFDLLGSVDRQKTFLWQVSGPRFSDDEFLRDGVERYHKFILLRKRVLDDKKQNENNKNNLGIIVPTYQIDLMWHTHMLSGLSAYHRDCKALLGGHTLNHDDGLSNRSEGGVLDVAFQETKELWKHSYHESYSVQGGMYRGEPPENFYSTEWDKSLMLPLQQLSCCEAQRLIGIHGATSTNTKVKSSKNQKTKKKKKKVKENDASAKSVVWAWKEDESRMSSHLSCEIVGDSQDCWIRYDPLSNGILEQAFESGSVICDLGTGYTVDFKSMEQTKTSTGYKRKVSRHTDAVIVADDVYLKATAQRGQEWTPLTGYAPDGHQAFLEPKPKSNQRGINANPQKDKYIFGRKGSQVGYFHITTKEAYEVLEQRTKAHAAVRESGLAISKCCTLGLCFKKHVKSLEDELEKIKDVQLIAEKRAKARGLDANVQLPERLKKNRDHFSSDGGWYFPAYYYTAGGGCGYYAASGMAGFGSGDCDAGACGGGGGTCVCVCVSTDCRCFASESYFLLTNSSRSKSIYSMWRRWLRSRGLWWWWRWLRWGWLRWRWYVAQNAKSNTVTF